MADRSPRLRCRAAFLLLGLLPTIATCGWAAWHHAYSNDAGRWANWLTTATGIDVHVGHVVTPFPGTWRLGQVQLFDPELDEELVRMPEVTLHEGPAGTGISIPQMTIALHQWPQFMRLMHERFLCQQRWLTQPRLLHIENLTLSMPRGGTRSTPIVLRHVLVDCLEVGNGPEILITSRRPDPQHEPIRVHILRDRRAATTQIELYTGAAPLPCRLLASPDSVLAGGLAHADFRGDLYLESSATGWSGELSGTLQGLVLEELPWHVPAHHASSAPASGLTGIAAANIRLATFYGGQLQSISGRVQAHGGSIRRALLDTLAERLPLHSTASEEFLPEADGDGFLDYARLDVDVCWSVAEARIVGLADGPDQQTLIAGVDGPLLESTEEVVDSLEVTRVLLGLGDNILPITAREQPLLRIVPR